MEGRATGQRLRDEFLDERTAILDADAVIAVSNGTKADILRVYPELQPEKIHVIYNGIDLAEYDRTSDTSALIKYGVDPSRPYVLFVGRITRKGRHSPGGGDPLLAARYPGGSVCGRAGHA